MNLMKSQCPECHVTLTRYQWSRLWWVSSGMSGRLVLPCAKCGALLRLSAMRMVTALGAMGLLVTSIVRFVTQSDALLVLALLFLTLILVGVVSTRVETVLRLAHDSPTQPDPSV